MSDPKQSVQKAPKALAECVVSDVWKSEIQKVIPKELLIDAFLRVSRTVASEAKFAQCDQRSFLGALLKCARAGLTPDGIHAHLIPFGKEVTCIFDWKGVVDLASRNDIEVTPKVVCEFDDFSVKEDDGTGKTIVTHSWGLKNRGTIVGYYSRARRSDGSVDYEFMTRDEVEETRKNYSNARNSKAWEKSFDEMAKKTVIKRHAKRWPISQEARAAMVDDDDSTVEAPLQVARPIFDSKPQQWEKAPTVMIEKAAAGAALEQPTEAEAPQPDPPEEQRQKEPEPKKEPEKQKPEELPKPLKQLRFACRAGGIKEGELLDYWGATGAIDGSQGTLEEVMLSIPSVIEGTVADFPAIAEKIKDARIKP